MVLLEMPFEVLMDSDGIMKEVITTTHHTEVQMDSDKNSSSYGDTDE